MATEDDRDIVAVDEDGRVPVPLHPDDQKLLEELAAAKGREVAGVGLDAKVRLGAEEAVDSLRKVVSMTSTNPREANTAAEKLLTAARVGGYDRAAPDQRSVAVLFTDPQQIEGLLGGVAQVAQALANPRSDAPTRHADEAAFRDHRHEAPPSGSRPLASASAPASSFTNPEPASHLSEPASHFPGASEAARPLRAAEHRARQRAIVAPNKENHDERPRADERNRAEASDASARADFLSAEGLARAKRAVHRARLVNERGERNHDEPSEGES